MVPADDLSRRLAAVLIGAATLLVAACQGPPKEALAASYAALAATANAASAPLLESLASTQDTDARGPILRGLAEVERTFADGLAGLGASGDVKAAADEVVRLSRAREAAFRAAAEATGEAQSAALAPILGEGGAAFHAAVERLRAALGLPSTDAGPTPSASGTRIGGAVAWGVVGRSPGTPGVDALATRPRQPAWDPA